jgi:hypothetical protein
MPTNFLENYKAANGSPELDFCPGRLLRHPAAAPDVGLLLAAVADYRLVVDLYPAPEVGTLGVAAFQRQGLPAELGVPQPLSVKPAGPLAGEHCGQALTLGPSYKEADGLWVPLAGVPREWCDLEVRVETETADLLDFEVVYRIGGGPTLWERYRLTDQGLDYLARIQWVVGGFRLQVPLFVTDGRHVGVPALEAGLLTLRIGRHALQVRALETDEPWEVEPFQYANMLGIYQNAYLQGRSAVEFRARLTLG